MKQFPYELSIPPASGWSVLWQEVAEPSYCHVDEVYYDKSAAEERVKELLKRPWVKTARIERYSDED